MPTSTQSIREIVMQHPSSANVFHRFDIDLCLQADLSLEGACQALQLSVDQVLEKLAAAEARECGGAALYPATLSLPRLIQHIGDAAFLAGDRIQLNVLSRRSK
jgi:iron-sulfur cluster repair protein YtfE (RIC family)